MAERGILDRDRNNRRAVAPINDDGNDDSTVARGKDSVACISSDSSSSSSSSGGGGGRVGGFVMTSLSTTRRGRQARRRVQPLGDDDEPEEASVTRMVSVPAAVCRSREEPGNMTLPETAVQPPTLSERSSANIRGSDRPTSPTATPRTAYVAAQLRQLAQAISSIPPSPAWGSSVGGDGSRGEGEGGRGSSSISTPPSFLLQPLAMQVRPETQLPEKPPSATTVSPQGYFFSKDSAATLDKHLGAPVDGSAATSSTGANPSPGRGDEGSGVPHDPSESQHSTLQHYLVSHLEQLSQLLHSPQQDVPSTMGGALGGDWVGVRSNLSVVDAERDRNLSFLPSIQKNETDSLQYSASEASSSRSSSPFSPSGKAAAAAARGALPADGEDGGGASAAATAQELRASRSQGTKRSRGTLGDSSSSSSAAPLGWKFASPSLSASWETEAVAPYGSVGGGHRPHDSRSPHPSSSRRTVGGEIIQADPAIASPVPVSSSGDESDSRSTSSPSADARVSTTASGTAMVQDDSVSADLEGGIGDSRRGERSSREVSDVSSSSVSRTSRLVREPSAESSSKWRSSSWRGTHRLTEAFGRAKLWRHMLEVESRTESAVMAGIEEENRGVLDQGVVLPCAPSDEEKVIYHTTGRCFLVSSGLFSVATLSSGLWLFTFAAPYFYWFAAPTAFIMGYLVISYLGVAVWGKNFDPDDHAAKVLKARHDRYYPSVDVFLPVCREPTHLLDNTWRYVRALDYPNLTVHVLDDGAKEEVRQLAAMHGFNYIRRNNIPELKKAGNLRYAFARTSGEVLAVFDADFCPRPEFLRETTPYFRDEDLAILQTPQFFRYREEQTWVEKGAGVTQELFYRMVQVNRNKFDASICVGTCGVYRREALAPFGGTAAIGYSEDVHTGFNCIKLGYKVKYIPQVMAMGTCPDEPRAFFMQQYRWCMGSTTLLCNREFWDSTLSGMQKLCYLSGMLYYSATALAIFTGPLPGMLLIWFKPEAVLWYNISFAVPSIVFGFVIMRCWAKQPYDLSCQRVKIIQSFSHLYALKDRVMNTSVPWVPTGGGASSRSSSQAYDSSVRLMLVWTMTYTLLTVGGAAWRITEFPWYHFLPTVLLSLVDCGLHISTLL